MRRNRIDPGDESGIALVMALGIMLVLTIALATVIAFTAAGARDAQRTNGGQKASSLAEAGVNNALSQLAGRYLSSNPQGNGAAPPISGGPVGAPTYNEGTVSWITKWDTNTSRWVVTGTGIVKNPTGGSDIVRTATAKIGVLPVTPSLPYGLFTGDPTAPCTNLGGGINVNVPIYVASTCGLTITGNSGGAEAKIWDPDPLPGTATMTIQVGGPFSRSGFGAKVGISTNKVKSIAAPSCLPSPCNAANDFHALTYSGAAAPIAMPIVDAAYEYGRANWSTAICTSGSQPFDNDTVRNKSKPSPFSLLQQPSYDCTATDGAGTPVGRLAWNSGTHQMTINGTIFIDGDLLINPSDSMQYSGEGTIYVEGTVTIKGTVCGPGSAFAFAPASCGMTWNPNLGKLLFVAANAGAPTVTTGFAYTDPGADGARNDWTKSAGGAGWSLLDEGVRNPAVPVTGTDRITSQTDEQYQEIRLSNSLTYSSAATYLLEIHGSGGTKRALDLQVSYNNGVTWQTRQSNVIPAGAGSAWIPPLTLAPGTTAGLNNLQVRLICKRTGAGAATAVAVNAAYLRIATPISTYPTPPVVTPFAFIVDSGANVEAGAWSVGNFDNTGSGNFGGSVFVQNGYANIAGNGGLKAFLTLPSGAPSLYGLQNAASEFG